MAADPIKRHCNFGGLCIVCGLPGVPFHAVVHPACAAQESARSADRGGHVGTPSTVAADPIRLYECRRCHQRILIKVDSHHTGLEGERHLTTKSGTTEKHGVVSRMYTCGRWRDVTGRTN